MVLNLYPCTYIYSIHYVPSDFLVASSYNHSDSDCFACAFLTHGDQINNENIVFANDAYIYNKDIFAFFKGDKCSSLAGKPKFFIFQVSFTIFRLLGLHKSIS